MNKSDEIRVITCSCCDGSAYGRQWRGRDYGYGLCAACADWMAARGETPEQMAHAYGTRGYHYDIPGLVYK